MTTPDPALPAAPLGRRIVAVVLDGLIVGVVAALVTSLFTVAVVGRVTEGDAAGVVLLWGLNSLVLFLLAVGWLFLLSALHSRGGSPGQRVLRVAVRRFPDGSPLSFSAALGRNLVFGLAGSIVIGYFSPLFDSSPLRRGWHDRAGGAVMVDTSGSTPAPAPPPPGAVPVSSAPPPASARGSMAEPAPTPPAPVPPPPASTPPAATTPATAPAAGLVSEVPGFSRRVEPDPPQDPPDPAPSAPTGAPRPEEVVDLADQTVLRDADDAAEDDIDETRLVAAARPVRPVLRVRWDDGAVHVVTGRTRFGRNPEPAEGASAVVIVDESRSLSKTHFELSPEESGGLLTDLHSTNGVARDRSGAPRELLTPGEPAEVLDGDVVVIGDRSFTLESGS